MGAVAGGLIGAALAAADATVTAHFLVAAATVGALNLTTLGLVRLPRVVAPPRPHRRACAGGTRARSSPSRRWASPRRCSKARRSSGARSTSPTSSHAASGVAAAATVTFTVGMVVARLVGDHLVRPLRSAGRAAVRRGRGRGRAPRRARPSTMSVSCSSPGSSSAPAWRRHIPRSSSPPVAHRVSHPASASARWRRSRAWASCSGRP